jgi:hypothetical protein
VKGKMSGEKKHGKKAKPFKMRADGGSVPTAGGKSRFEALERVGKGYQPPPPKQRASGGAISDSSDGGTQVQHSGNKSDSQNIGRGAVITRATGGPIYADGKKGHQMAWLKGVGAGGGKGRLKKAAHERAS